MRAAGVLDNQDLRNDTTLSSKFRAAFSEKVVDHTGKPSLLPAMGGASAENLRVLDYLIHEPVRTALVQREDVGVDITAPEHYGVRMLIVVSRRRNDGLGRTQRDKDLQQTSLWFEWLAKAEQCYVLADAIVKRGIAHDMAGGHPIRRALDADGG